MEGKELFAAINSTLNTVSAALLICGFVFIRAKLVRAHIACMISALVSSGVFLSFYLASKAIYGDHRLKNYSDGRSIFYLIVLIPHVLLAIGMLPMIAMTIYYAATRQFKKHVRIAPWTFGIWLYVSITGVGIYFLMYRLLKPAGLM